MFDPHCVLSKQCSDTCALRPWDGNVDKELKLSDPRAVLHDIEHERDQLPANPRAAAAATAHRRLQLETAEVYTCTCAGNAVRMQVFIGS